MRRVSDVVRQLASTTALIAFGAQLQTIECQIAKQNQKEPCIASAVRMKARLVPFGFSLLFQLQDARAYCVERLFGRLAEQRILMIGQGRRDLRPILRL